MPLGGALFLITMIAEVERVPFDMPEAEAELVEVGGLNMVVCDSVCAANTFEPMQHVSLIPLLPWRMASTIQGIVEAFHVRRCLPPDSSALVLIKAWLVFLIVSFGLDSHLLVFEPIKFLSSDAYAPSSCRASGCSCCSVSALLV